MSNLSQFLSKIGLNAPRIATKLRDVGGVKNVEDMFPWHAQDFSDMLKKEGETNGMNVCEKRKLMDAIEARKMKRTSSSSSSSSSAFAPKAYSKSKPPSKDSSGPTSTLPPVSSNSSKSKKRNLADMIDSDDVQTGARAAKRRRKNSKPKSTRIIDQNGKELYHPYAHDLAKMTMALPVKKCDERVVSQDNRKNVSAKSGAKNDHHVSGSRQKFQNSQSANMTFDM